jgi:membrane protein YdbS with pleckstrin-like domain
MQQLDPRAVWMFFVNFAASWLFLAVILVMIWGSIMLSHPADDASGMMWVAGFFIVPMILVLVSLVFCWIWARLSYHFYRYELREDGFRKELGVIVKQYTTIAYDRIQNVDIRRGVVDRILGLSSLNIQTAGSFGSEGVLPGLSHEVAEQLRDELIKRARQSRTTNQGL